MKSVILSSHPLLGNTRRAYRLLLKDNLKFKKEKPLTYLAGPYTSDSPPVKNYRFEMLTKAAAWLMNNFPHLNVFSPITSSHPLHVIGGMRGDWEFWKRVDTEYLNLCGLFVVVMLDGWEKSVGVTAELKIAKELKIPTIYLDPGSHNF